ncbi:ABC-2 type transport system ATP-binding protein [Haloactinopolyspora alba]|uniref:ABC-2 type transport system ATP-binding protein n=1 Tax=Haloactinopolyspora alba TaxID=648780 RepID=A0A2P8EFY8_9ACTN|nr:ABC transporter ATP-binding protein [Haloactinopolyspora alba]PSL08383.1 ABC-2 type transport system ATP-binding protein [Haloactinopolyspora alba]
MDAVISVEHCRKSYRDVLAVEDVSFTVARGEIFGLLGPNGAGKTSTVECLQGLRRRDAGTVEVLGTDPDRRPDRVRRRIGSQLQSSALPDRLRVGEAVRLFAAGRGSALDVAEILDAWDLTAVRGRAFAALSGGQQQRLFLALALLGRPEIVFLDELTTGLDPQARRSTWDLVRAARDNGTTVVLVTHLMEEAEALCDRVAIVDRGRVVALDSPGMLTARLGGDITMTFTADGHDPAHLAAVPGVSSVRRTGEVATVAGAGDCVVRVASALAERGVTPSDFRTHHPTLEDVFLATTGRTLRD